ncbi:hypothetical protein ACH5RR_040050 [Cinchona calisaya]|uniref:Histone-lysine N-methyltransferase n=1 Tax=Cinchona calisaya TaxID=153742 RepID=A0ABD2XS40_9GENT
MENSTTTSSWLSKCARMWQSSPASSSTQSPQNQIFNGSSQLHSSPPANPTPSMHKLAPEAVYPWNSNLSCYNLDHTEHGSSFLSLLSGPPCITRNEVPVCGSKSSVFTAGGEFSLLTSGQLEQNLNSQNVEPVANLGLDAPSKGRMGADQGSNSCINNVLQGSYSNLQKLEISKAGMHQKLFCNDNQTDFSSLRVGYVDDASPSNVWKIHSSNIVGVSQKVPVKTDSSVSGLSPMLLTRCPQVFCLGLRGDLLLSSNGLFGVVCSCHGFHMSISRFSEHSGLCNVNPGDAVRMDSGETIAQWRKAYFHNFGIRIPEDDMGWDWPQGLSVTAGCVTHGLTMPNMSTDSDHCNQGSSFGASVQSVNPWSYVLHPKHSQTAQKVTEEFVRSEKPLTILDGKSLLSKAPSSSLKNSLSFVADNQMMGSSRSECSTMPNLVGGRGTYSVCQAISSYKDPGPKSGDSVCLPYFPNLKMISKDIAIRRSIGSPVDVDTASSNVELRLGQPSQQTLASGSSIVPASGSSLIGTRDQPQNSFFLDQHVHKTGSSQSVDRSRQRIYMAGTMSSSTSRREQSQLVNVNHAHEIYGVPNASQNKHQNGDMPRVSGTSESLVNLRSPCEEKNRCKPINDVMNISHIMASKVHSESFPAKSGQFDFPLLRGEVRETEFITNVLGSLKHQKVNKVGCTSDGLQGTAELKVGSQSNSKGRMWSFSGVSGDSDHMNYSVLHDKVPNMCPFNGILANEPDTRNTVKYFGQVSYPAQIRQHEPNLFRTITSPTDLGAIISPQGVSMGMSATNYIPIKSKMPSSSQENIDENPYFLDENLKMIAFHSVSALSNQNLSAGTSKITSEPEVSRNNCGKTQVVVPPLVSEMRKNGFDFANVPNASEVVTGTLLSANLTFIDNERIPSVAGSRADKKLNHSDTNKWRNIHVPTASQGWYCHGKDTDIPCHFSPDLQPRRQFFLRLGGNENISQSSEAGNCYQELPSGCFPSKFSCTSNSNCLTGKPDQLGKTSLGEFREQKGNTVDLVAPFSSPKLGKNCRFADKDDSFFQNKNIVQNMKKAECNSFEWRDVPRKVVTDATVAATKCSAKSAHALKEQETSEISSGCSAPAVTQASNANYKDSSTVDGVDEDLLVGDEGSGIERCWSSDDESERSAEFCGFASKINLVDRRPSKACSSKLSHGLIDELRFRDSLKIRKMQNWTNTRFPIQASDNLLQKYDMDSNKGKRTTVKWNRSYSSVSASTSAVPAALNGSSESGGDAGHCSCTVKNMQMLPRGDQQSFSDCPCSLGQNLKRKRSAFSSFDAVSKKRDLCRINHIEVEKTDLETSLTAKRDSFKASEFMGRKKSRFVNATEGVEPDDMHDSTCIISEIAAKVTAVDCNTASSKMVNVCHRRRRPVVCGKYGIISNANSLKPAKIVSLRTVLKGARRFSSAESRKMDFVPIQASKKANSSAKKEMKKDVRNVDSAVLHSQHSVEGIETVCSLGRKDSYDLSHIMKKRRHDGSRSHAIPDSVLSTQLRRKYKEVRIRSIYELTVKENDSSRVKSPVMKDGTSLLQTKSRYMPKLAENAGDDKMSTDGTYIDNKSSKEENCQNSLDVFCCVCGSSDTDENNTVLECNHCFIKVHQACYGVSKVPKARWYCRPCKTSSKNTVCVLCGYGGGAMTQALRSSNIVKSLLKAWNSVAESNSENPRYAKSLESSFKMLSSTKSVGDSDPFLIIRPAHMESTSVALWNTDLSEHVDTVDIPSSTPAAPVLFNSITAGVLDSTVKQWVHMVCGLWTPGTRCPNVHTMSAFDVSGVCLPKQDVVCSICQRSGGSCIHCRVADCDVQFHPWCAHQKGLLQSEVEGAENESVGFYGRCMVHAMYRQFDSDGYQSSQTDHGERESTCTRTEGYKGRKRDGFHHNLPQHSDGSSGCLVPQEQLNAWIHINGQKSCTRGPLKPPTSAIEYDCRKEYARYKQSRGWKHLVVYKSRIHGLGLYTSQFISRGGMVVEYVGEIVGLHVADKRETEYQAGKKLQYKSACYFFRIDKELIIDATRKGGIARFVNHSCLPNCVAKVISVRNEKKVVFFAERDIYPGEEVTYDYHFNHEDEGKKIPCYCNSKNCRRYLN